MDESKARQGEGFRAGLPVLVVFAATGLFQLPFFDLWFSMMDEGHMLQFADLRLRGGEFYRDATFYPLPGAFHFLALVFQVFGASILVSRWIVLLEFALFVALLFYLMRKITSTSWALVGVGCLWLYRVWCFPHWQIYSYSTTSLLVLLGSITALVLYLERRDRRMLAFSGLLFGLGVLCKQDYGAAVMIAVLVCLFVFVRTEPPGARPSYASVLFTFLLPAAAVGALTGFYYWRVGVLADLMQFTVFNHFAGMGQYEYSEFPDLLPLFVQDLALRTKLSITEFMPGIMMTVDWSSIRTHPLFTDTALYDFLVKLFFFGPQVLLGAVGFRAWTTRERLRSGEASPQRLRFLVEFLFLCLGSAFIFLVWLNKPQDYVHLAVLYWPLIFLAICLAHGSLAGKSGRVPLVAAIALVPALVLVAYSGRLLANLHSMHSELVSGPRAGVYVKPGEAEMLEGVVEYIRANSEPGDPLAALPYFPLANFLAERAAPHRSAYIVWPFPEIPDRDRVVAEAMEASGTDLVLYNFTQFESFDPVWEHAPHLFAYLVENFEIDRIFSYRTWGYKPAALRRRTPEEQTPGVALMPGSASHIALRIDDEAGPPRVVPPESRSEYFERMLWPFRPVIALRPSAGARRSVLALPLRVPEEGGRLLTAVAVHPQRWFNLPASWVDFRLAIRTSSGLETLFERRLNPTYRLEDRGWFEIDLDLGTWAGEEVSLEFSNGAENRHGEALFFGGWAEPRMVAPGTESDVGPEAG